MRDLALHLSPVAMLTVAFPLAAWRIGAAEAGGVPLTALLLATSLTVPWLSQAVCTPLYRGLGALLPGGDHRALGERFCEVWPWMFLQSLAAVLVLAVPVHLVLRWPAGAAAAFLTLCVLHVAFTQALVLTNVTRRRDRWALAWAAYAAALLAAPTAWFLPPVAGLLALAPALRPHLPRLRHAERAPLADTARDLLRGLLLGAVLWADKVVFLLVADGRLPVTVVFVALLPTVVATNHYFVRLAPAFDAAVLRVRQAMEHEPYRVLAVRSAELSATVRGTLVRTAATGAALTAAEVAAVAVLAPGWLPLLAAVAVASWAFLVLSVLCYKIDYIGERGTAQLLGAVHLAVCAVAFALAPTAPAAYAWIALAEAAVLVVAVRLCLRHWQDAEYTLFWRHATAW
ncbi:hypothetical protein NUM3379_20230 [Kineococcus sp. NUM-3379]